MKRLPFFLLLLLPGFVWAQQNAVGDKPAYPQDYFRNPLNIPIFLAGNFGECRPGHFHSGMDIKTLGAENQPVHAAADGYISRIKMEPGGFGHGLYITHPNGYTTLYAHLNRFAPAIQKYMVAQQYKQRRWNVDVQLSPRQFPVKKGELIAWSGNTGASTAPHLHFEIRNTKTEHPLNGEQFGLPVIDKTPPVPTEVDFYWDNPGGVGSFYSGGKLSATLEKKGDVYGPAKSGMAEYPLRGDTISLPQGDIGIGMDVNDYMDGSNNTIAFYTAKLYWDDSLQAQITLDNIGYDETRYINAYADYKTKELDNKWIQLLFQLPGNHLDDIYSHLNAGKGRIKVADKLVHKVEIVITDDKGNVSRIAFYVKGNGAMPPATEGLPGTPFYANRVNVFKDSDVSFTLDDKDLYDDISFVSREKEDDGVFSDKVQLDYPYVPLHHYFSLGMRANKTIPGNLAGKVAMMYSDGKDEDGRAAAAEENGWYKAKVRNFGTYWLAIDTIPPVIKSLQKDNSNLGRAKQITFEVKDAMTSVNSFSGYLDGKWICFEQHNDLYFYKFDEHCPRGKHKLVFKAEDENGNKSEYTLTFKR